MMRLGNMEERERDRRGKEGVKRRRRGREDMC